MEWRRFITYLSNDIMI